MMGKTSFAGLAAAAVLASGLSVTAAGAVTAPVFDEDTGVDLSSANLFVGTVVAVGGSGMYTVEFTSSVPGSATANVAITEGMASSFSGLTMSWVGSDGGAIVSSPVSSIVTSLSTMLLNPDSLTQSLVFAWSDSLTSSGFSFDVAPEISPIPVPAAGLLLLTGIAGLGALRSRCKASVSA